MFYTVDGVDPFMSAEQARERMCSALDAIDAAHEVLRQTPSAVVGNAFRVDFAERLEAQDRLNRGLMYRVFGEIADPPDEAGCVPAMRGMLWARLRIPPKEVTRRFRLAARLRSRRSLTGAPLEPELGSTPHLLRPGPRMHPPQLPGTRVSLRGGQAQGSPCARMGRRRPADADNLFFPCGSDHGAVGRGERRTVVVRNGRLGWTDGNGPPVVNHADHPDELLRGDPDPP